MGTARSVSGRTYWECSNGRLTEIGGDSYKFTLSALDTKILLDLLKASEEEIEMHAALDEHLKGQTLDE